MEAWSGAVSYWQNLNVIDDEIARKQWTAITSKDSPTTIDRRVSDVRKILEAYQDEMRQSGASYQEMFKKVKMELVRKYKAVL